MESKKAKFAGKLAIGDMSLNCFVDEDGERYISGRSITAAIGMKGRGQGMARIGQHPALQSFISNDLALAIQHPVELTGQSPIPVLGYKATILPEICDAFLDARKAGALKTEQEKRYGDYAEILVRTFSKIGVIALVDEATGYQEVRDKKALQAILDKYLRKELAAWAKRFPDDFYKEMFRLRDWNWSFLKRPAYVGKLTNDLIYERITPGLLEELQKRSPKNDHGKRKGTLQQLFTEDVGHPALAQHLHAIIGLMRASSNWDGFYRLLQRAFPKKGDTLDLLDD